MQSAQCTVQRFWSAQRGWQIWHLRQRRLWQIIKIVQIVKAEAVPAEPFGLADDFVEEHLRQRLEVQLISDLQGEREERGGLSREREVC